MIYAVDGGRTSEDGAVGAEESNRAGTEYSYRVARLKAREVKARPCRWPDIAE
jgi:hypothetical protein